MWVKTVKNLCVWTVTSHFASKQALSNLSVCERVCRRLESAVFKPRLPTNHQKDACRSNPDTCREHVLMYCTYSFEMNQHTHTHTHSVLVSYHWIDYEAAAYYLHAVHNVTDGFTLSHLCRQLEGKIHIYKYVQYAYTYKSIIYMSVYVV